MSEKKARKLRRIDYRTLVHRYRLKRRTILAKTNILLASIPQWPSISQEQANSSEPHTRR